MAKIKGLDKVLKELKTYGEKAEKEIGNVTETVIKEMLDVAKTEAPKDTGDLSLGIFIEKINELNQKLVSSKSHSGFIEFGTGAKVNVPSELQDQANKFKGKSKGNFKIALENIKAWCKRKGIPESSAYPILMSLLNKGMKPQPYMYPALLKGRSLYEDELKQLLKELSK